jgi:hypothetical protein
MPSIRDQDELARRHLKKFSQHVVCKRRPVVALRGFGSVAREACEEIAIAMKLLQAVAESVPGSKVSLIFSRSTASAGSPSTP